MPHDLDIPDGRGERVLAVDDDPRIAGFMGRWFELLGYRARVETRPAAALELVRAAPEDWDLVVTDYLMPEMNGLQLAANIRALNPALPVLLTTGVDEELTQESIRNAGVQRVIRKPVFMKSLAQALRDLLD